MSQNNPPGSEPHFIEIGDADDIPLPLPIFVTRQGVDRSHDDAMRKVLQADPAYAAELRVVLTTEGATDALAILDRYTSGERLQRLEAVDFARASVGLEGFKPSVEDEELARAFMEGEITLDEFIKRSIEST